MRRPRRWAAVGMAFCALASASGAGASGIWDDPAFALYREAVEAMSAQDYDRARALAAQAIAHYPGHLLAHYLVGQAAMARGLWDDAAAAFRAALRLYPDSFAARRDLAAVLEQAGRVDEAAQAWDAALALRPDDEDARVRLAFMLLRSGRRDAARPHLERLATRDTKVPDVWAALARMAYERHDLNGAEQAYGRAAELRDDGTMWFNLGVVRLRLQDLAGALHAFEKAARHAAVRERARAEIEKLQADTTRRDRR